MSKITVEVNKKTISEVYNQVAMCNDLGFPNFQKGEPINNLMREIKEVLKNRRNKKTLVGKTSGSFGRYQS